MARLNHSCAPNVILMHSRCCDPTVESHNKSIVVSMLSTRPINANDELCITYLSQSCAALDARRLLLSQGFGFLCTCDRCRLEEENASIGDSDLSLLSNQHKSFPESIKLFEMVETYLINIDLLEIPKIYKKIIQIVLAMQPSWNQYLEGAEGVAWFQYSDKVFHATMHKLYENSMRIFQQLKKLQRLLSLEDLNYRGKSKNINSMYDFKAYICIPNSYDRHNHIL